MRWLLAIALVACSSSSTPSKPPKQLITAPTRNTIHEVMSEEVTFGSGVPGTLTTPKLTGKFPAILLLAGSGPTDRDWNSPLIASKNGSAALLATELSKHGLVVLRFDKAGTGKNTAKPTSLDTYRDEAAAALAFLRSRGHDRIYLAGHSEGGIHATRLAQTEKVAGIIYLASASRTMVDTILAQIESQLKNPAAMLSERAVEVEMTSLRKAFTDFLADKPVDPQQASKIPQLQALVTQLVNPSTATLTRTLLGFDVAVEAPKLTGPFLVLNGGKDVQIDADLDGKRLDKALRDAGRDVTFHLAADADHVLKHEPKSQTELRANLLAVQNGYNADGRVIDPDVVRAIVSWLSVR